MSNEEQSNTQTESAIKLADHISSKFPQERNFTLVLDDNLQVETPPMPEGIKGPKKVDYVIAGSLATMILSQTSEFTELDTSKPPYYSEGKVITIPEKAHMLFSEFARPVGDFDYIPSKDYLKRKLSDKDFTSYLGNGGGSLPLSEMPPEVLKAVKVEDYQTLEGSSFSVDPLQSLLPEKIIKARINGKDYFLPSPETMVSYKVLNMLESYAPATSEKKGKFNKDFPRLLEAIESIYSEEDLIETTRELLVIYDDAMKDVYRAYHQEEDPDLSNYQSKMPEMVSVLLRQEDLSAQTREFLNKLVAYDDSQEKPLLRGKQT